MKIIPPRSTSLRTLVRSASVNRNGRCPVRYTSGYSRILSDDSGMITPTGAVGICVYRATESIRFAGRVGALSQSPDSYRPVQKTKSLTSPPTMPAVLTMRPGLRKEHDGHAAAAALHHVPF